MTPAQNDPDSIHPITVTPTPGRVRVVAGESVVAESTGALTVREADYPPVQYVPLADLDPAMLTRSATSTYCPFKGDASYFSLSTPGGEVPDAGWVYEQPYEAVAVIGGHIAFYPDKVRVVLAEALEGGPQDVGGTQV